MSHDSNMSSQNIISRKDSSPFNLFSIYSYTWQVLEETLRYSITAPFAARVSNDKNLTIDGHLVPAGIPIALAIGVLLSDEKYFPDLEK